MIKKRFISMLVLLAAVVTGAWADELTVHDGTATNENVPVYGVYADAYLKCEMVMPASELSAMNGSEISAMTFYSSKTNMSWGSASFTVFLKEVSEATIGGFSGPGTVVYEGALSIVAGEMTVTFTTPYTYNGGNLLIGVYNTAIGDFLECAWYGETVSGASVQGYDYNALAAVMPTQRNFLPKTTFTYEAPEPTATAYTVTLKEGTDDATSWTITPEEAKTTGVAAGTEVKATYGGVKKVKSVKAKKKAAASPIISLSGRTYLDDELVIADGYIVTGSAYAFSCKVAVADGATVTLRDVENDNGSLDPSSACPGIRCIGDATIILEGNNTVKGSGMYAGIFVPEGKTLTIRGTGSLTVTGGSRGAGIGGNIEDNCGSIVIEGGTIVAEGGDGAAGIGLGYSYEREFGDITISGGTVTATGCDDAPGIGGREAYFQNITITDGVNKLTVNKGSGSTYSIGTSESDYMEYCGAITIGGTVYLNEGYFENNGDSYLQTSPLVYQP